MAKVTEKLKLILPSPEDRIDIDILNSNYEILESQIYSNLIKKKTSISEESNFGEVIPPYVTITNTNLEAVNVTVGEEKIIIPAASTIAVAIKDKKELSIDTDGVIAVEYFISNERYASEQSGSAVDSELSEASENPVQNKVITAKFKEYYSIEEVNELIDGIGTPEDVYTKTETDNLLSAKADKSDTYTKTETDTKITEKVSEIVAGAPEDFDTLKEMSDWLTEHEDSAATMNSAIQKNAEDIETANSAIQQNKTDISSLNTEMTKKVDKVNGKSLIDDSEIERLASVDNYDDTAMKNDIVSIKSQAAINKTTLGTQCKNLLKNTAMTATKKGITFTVNADKSVTVNGTSTARADFFLAGAWGSTTPIFAKNSYKASMLPNVETTDRGLYMHVVNNETVLNGVSTKDKYKVVNNEITAVYLSISAGKTFDNYTVYPMLTYADVTDTTYEPYTPSLQEQINALTARIAALEGTATTAE
jgi:hypothetical protein